MNLKSFSFLPKACLGVDVGTSYLKVVEISRWGDRKRLKNYGELHASALYNKPFRTFDKNALLLSNRDIARAVRAIVEEADIKTKKAVFSLPDFSSFFTNFMLPPMSKRELPNAVEYESRKHVPLPFSEVALDWQVVDGVFNEKKPSRILIVAVPNEIMAQYQEIARLAKLELAGMEAEVFGLIRSSLGDDEGVTVILDIGSQSTTVSLVYKGVLRTSRSLDVAGNSFTERIAQSLSISREQAEQLKAEKGIEFSADNAKILSPLIDLILLEVQRVSEQFLQIEKKGIEKILIGGGTAILPGLQTYIGQNLQVETEIINPFRSVFYTPILEKRMKEMGPSYAVSVGAALRGLAS
jgi:type IV pilus assembly protein PilM